MNWFIILASCLFPLSFLPVPEEGISIHITGLRNNKGHVLVSLFRDGKGYPDEPEKAVRKLRLEIRNQAGSALVTGIPPGIYAVAILHDENDDLKMNKNFFGLPKEGYGFSNNVMGTFGPPSFSRASFTHRVQQKTEVRIRARY